MSLPPIWLTLQSKSLTYKNKLLTLVRTRSHKPFLLNPQTYPHQDFMLFISTKPRAKVDLLLFFLHTFPCKIQKEAGVAAAPATLTAARCYLFSVLTRRLQPKLSGTANSGGLDVSSISTPHSGPPLCSSALASPSWSAPVIGSPPDSPGFNSRHASARCQHIQA